MRILISGSQHPSGFPKSLGGALTRVGCDIVSFDDEKLHADISPSNRVLKRILTPFKAQYIGDSFVHSIKSQAPNVVLVVKGFFFSPTAIREARSAAPKAKFVYFNPDNSFNTWHYGNSNAWIRSSRSLYDVELTWGKFLEGPLRALGARRVHHFPFAFDPLLHTPPTKFDEVFKSEVSFVGSWDEEREWWLSRIVDFDLKIWGNGWEKASSSLRRSCWQGTAAYGQEFYSIVKQSKVNINLLRRQNASAHNMRSFEIPGCGGLMLATRSAEHLKIFRDEHDAFFFDSAAELRDIVPFLLNNDFDRFRVAENGYQKVIQTHTYDNRAKDLLEIITSIV